MTEINPLLFILAAGFYINLLFCFNSGWRAANIELMRHARLPSTGQTFHAIDALRGIAILMVVLFHIFQWFNSGFHELGKLAIIRNGWSGVELFVVLSGFLIYRAVKRGGLGIQGLVAYFKRRFYRIYPVYFVAMIVGIIIITIVDTPFPWHKRLLQEVPQHSGAMWVVAYELFILRAANWNLPEIINPPAWSLGAELTFYALIPLYYIISKQRPVLWSGITFATLLFFKSYGTREFGLFPFFFMGVLLSDIDDWLEKHSVPEGVWIITLIVSLILVYRFINGEWVGFAGNHIYGRSYKTEDLVLGYGLLLLSVLRNKGIANFISWYPLRVIGIISYSVFLWHFALFFVSGLHRLDSLSIAESMTITLFLIIPATIFLSALSYVAVERPIIALKT